MKWNIKFSLIVFFTLMAGLLTSMAYEDRYEDGRKISKKELKAYRRELQRTQAAVVVEPGNRWEVTATYARNKGSRDYWVPENVYRDWDHHSRHYYNHHYYGWRGGAWIIVEPGYSSEFYVSDSMVSRVQARLAYKGYYRGPIDGDAGPGTRAAIAAYQAHNGMRVTGHINEALLASLHL